MSKAMLQKPILAKKGFVDNAVALDLMQSLAAEPTMGFFL